MITTGVSSIKTTTTMFVVVVVACMWTQVAFSYHTVIPSAMTSRQQQRQQRSTSLLQFVDSTMNDAPVAPDRDPNKDDPLAKSLAPFKAKRKAREAAEKIASAWNVKKGKLGNLTIASFNKPIDLNPKKDPNEQCKNVPVPSAIGGNWNTVLPHCITKSPLDGKTCVQWSHKCLRHESSQESPCAEFGDHLECWKYEGCGKQKRCIEFANKCATYNDEEGFCVEFGDLKPVTPDLRLAIRQNYDSYLMTCCSAEDMEARQEKAKEREAEKEHQNTGSCTQTPAMMKLVLGELEGVSREMLDTLPMDEWMNTRQYIVHDELELRQAITADGGAWITFAKDLVITLMSDLNLKKSRVIIDGRGRRVVIRGNRSKQARINIMAPLVIIMGLTFTHFTGTLPGATWINKCQGTSDDECKRMSSRDILYIPDGVGYVWIHRCRFRGLSRAINIGGRAHYELPPSFIESGPSQKTTVDRLGNVVPIKPPILPNNKNMATGYQPVLARAKPKPGMKQLKEGASNLITGENAMDQRITVSWCRFDNHWDAVLFRSPGRLTIHHCYFRNVRGGVPQCAVKDALVHAFNLIVDGFGMEGASSGHGCSSLHESSTFMRAKWTGKKTSAIMCDRGTATIREVFMPDDPQQMMCDKPTYWEPCRDYQYHVEWDGDDQEQCRPIGKCRKDRRMCVQNKMWAQNMIRSISNPKQPCFLVDDRIHLY